MANKVAQKLVNFVDKLAQEEMLNKFYVTNFNILCGCGNNVTPQREVIWEGKDEPTLKLNYECECHYKVEYTVAFDYKRKEFYVVLETEE